MTLISPIPDDTWRKTFSEAYLHRTRVSVHRLAWGPQNGQSATEIPDVFIESTFLYDTQYEQLAGHISKESLRVPQRGRVLNDGKYWDGDLTSKGYIKKIDCPVLYPFIPFGGTSHDY